MIDIIDWYNNSAWHFWINLLYVWHIIPALLLGAWNITDILRSDIRSRDRYLDELEKHKDQPGYSPYFRAETTIGSVLWNLIVAPLLPVVNLYKAGELYLDRLVPSLADKIGKIFDYKLIRIPKEKGKTL